MNTDKPSDPIEVLRDLHDPECVTRQFISGRLSDAGLYEVQYRLLDGPHWFPVHKTPRCDCGANAAIAALEAERAKVKKVAAEMRRSAGCAVPYATDVDNSAVWAWADELDPSGSEPKAEGK